MNFSIPSCIRWYNEDKSCIYASYRLQSRVYAERAAEQTQEMVQSWLAQAQGKQKGQQNRPRKWFSHGWLRLRGSRTNSGNGSDRVGSHSGGEYSSNNALLALWLEVVDKVYEAKWYILLFDQRNGIAGYCLWCRSYMMNDNHGLEWMAGLRTCICSGGAWMD